jgi:hypothetical protein
VYILVYGHTLAAKTVSPGLADCAGGALRRLIAAGQCQLYGLSSEVT